MQGDRRSGRAPGLWLPLRAELFCEGTGGKWNCFHRPKARCSESMCPGYACADRQVMGDKLESKKLAKSAGVNTIPGFSGVIQVLSLSLSLSLSLFSFLF